MNKATITYQHPQHGELCIAPGSEAHELWKNRKFDALNKHLTLAVETYRKLANRGNSLPLGDKT
jgi:hypothetical protein